MTSASTAAWCSNLIQHLAEPAIRSLLLAGLVWVGLRLLRTRDASVRLAAWRSVLCCALAMPLLTWLLPAVPLPVPEVFAAAPRPAASPLRIIVARETAPLPPASAPPAETDSGTRAAPRENRGAPWSVLAVGFCVLVAGCFLVRFCLGFVLSGRLRRNSRPISDAVVQAILQRQAEVAGLRRIPQLAESAAVAVPVTLGIRQPMILVPSTWPQWEARKLRAVLAHEISHVVRHDALTQALAKFHRCVFWFSPLSGWLEHHLAELAEQASDDAALRAVSDRTYYAELLLGFLAALEGARGRIYWQGVSMAKGANVHRRVDHILTARTALMHGWKRPAWAGALLMAVPLVCLAAAVRPEVRRPTRSLMSGAMTVRAAAPAADIGAVPKAGLELAALGYGAQQAPTPPAPAAAPSAPGPRPAPAARPAIAAAPAKPQPPSPPNAFHWANYSDDHEDGEAYAIVSGDSISMSGGPADMRHAKSLQNKIAGDYIWFRHDGKGYVIRDAATVRRAKELFAPQEALGGQQEELGKKQEELGRQQDALGKKMEEVRIKVPDMSAELKRLEQQLAKLREGGTMQELGEAQSALGELQSRLGQLQGQAGGEQGKLGAMQGELGRQQGELGAQQGRLGSEQGRLAREATRKTKTLLDEALKNGSAQPE